MIFVDTSFWVALTLRRDDRHRDATRLRTALDDQELLTSDHVRGETWTFLRRRDGHRRAVAFVDVLDRTPRVRVVAAGNADEEALRWLRRHDERNYSYVDATSFALMRSLGIHEALAFDGDFAAAGFVELRP